MEPTRSNLVNRLRSLNERLLLHTLMLLAVPAWLVCIAWFFSLTSALADIVVHTAMHVYVATISVLAFAIVGCLVRRKAERRNAWMRRFLLLAIPSVLLTFVVRPWTLLRMAEACESSQGTKIVVWNMYLMNDSVESVEELIQKHDPDILALIECNPEVGQWLSKVRSNFATELWGVSWRSQSIIVLCKFPDAKLEMMDLEGMKTASVRFKTKDSQKEHQLYIGHTLSPKWPGNRVAIRNSQLDALATLAEEHSDAPVIVMGDLNTSPWSRAFSNMLQNGSLIDSRDYRGYCSSWPSLFDAAGIPIDHVLINKHVKVVCRSALDEAQGSDHRPIMIEVQ